MAEETPAERPSKNKQREKWFTFLGFVGFSALEIWSFWSKGFKIEHWPDWILLGGAIFFPVMAVLTLLSLRNDWSPEKEENALTRGIFWLIAIPVVVVAAGVAIWVVTSTFGWLKGIPSWAAVIIALLVLILLKERR